MTTSWRLRRADLAARGDAPALVGAGPALSYRELGRAAGALAAALGQAGLRGGDRVGVLSAARGHDEAVAVAGALLAQGTVVPLDPSAPPLRLAEVLAGCGCRAIIHDAAAAERLGAPGLEGQLARFELDPAGRLVARRGSAPAVAAADPEIACILHTSGSTGRPKAIPIRWEGLAAFTAWMIELTGLGPGDRVLRSAELVFDLAWFDHVATWRAGATLCTVARRELGLPSALLAAAQRLRPTVVYAVPALYSRLVAALGPGRNLDASLRVACFAGEVFAPRELRELARRAPGARLFNLFGPTETNVCTFHEVDRSRLDRESELPIGVACPYARCALVAEDGSGAVIAGPGTGELVVEGPTALGGRVATGDRVERAADGLFYFRGRKDRMLKIRGYRIEPGEIEAALCAHPRVREAAVLAREHRKLGTVLHGFVALDPGKDEASEREMRAFVAGRLPAYMVPERIRVREALPRTSTGKIDYLLLAAEAC
ncbi:MAG: AMP-binding protein [Deltaproteobacteria bacterium]|nr:AMP-binding protein [Deltaproteobacteria bacterium]